jgi:Xaa-Pro aminopeptidase
VSTLIDDETVRVQRLLDAQAQAADLFDRVAAAGIVRPGVSEQAASDAIRDLAAAELGVKHHWHKRIVRAGANTLQPYRQNPPDRVIEADDIVFLDFGPIFEDWEADFGRTFVLGNDARKHQLCDDLPRLFDAGRQHFEQHQEISGEELFAHVVGLAETAGWEWGGRIAGHMVGQFPHDDRDGDEILSDIAPGSTGSMRGLDSGGRERHWILEIHLVDRARQIGGFYEELLDIGHS